MEQYQFKITLDKTSPEIWRRIVVPSDMNLIEFHLAIQISMGWTNSHLFEFKINGSSYQALYEHDEDFETQEYESAVDQMLFKLHLNPGEKFYYLYDFGDSWEHTVIFEKSEPAEDDFEHPICIDGAQACPPEDCGGLGGFYQMLQILKTGSPAARKEYTVWLGKKFDPEKFEIKKVNKELKKIGDWIYEWFADEDDLL